MGIYENSYTRSDLITVATHEKLGMSCLGEKGAKRLQTIKEDEN
jgi:hypothetical protein